MVVIALLALLAGVTAIGVYRAVDQERFESGVAQLVNRLQIAQEIMLVAQGDVEIELERQGNAVLGKLLAKQPLEPLLAKYVQRSQQEPLAGIESFTWTTQEGTRTENEKTRLEFKSSGTWMSAGELELRAGSLKRYILLPGLPEMIVSSAASRYSELEMGLSAETALDRLYPSEVREVVATFEEKQRTSKTDVHEKS